MSKEDEFESKMFRFLGVLGVALISIVSVGITLFVLYGLFTILFLATY